MPRTGGSFQMAGRCQNALNPGNTSFIFQRQPVNRLGIVCAWSNQSIFPTTELHFPDSSIRNNGKFQEKGTVVSLAHPAIQTDWCSTYQSPVEWTTEVVFAQPDSVPAILQEACSIVMAGPGTQFFNPSTEFGFAGSS